MDSGLVDEIGNTVSDPIKVSTRGNELTTYKLVESGADTGIFIGEVTLAGFEHDADGDVVLDTMGIMVIGLLAFSAGTAVGVLMAKLMNKVSPADQQINPLIGAAGVSAVPMSARVVSKVGQEYDKSNILLMHAMGPNVAGVIGSAVAAGVLLSIFK
jgi:Na+-transporting methylmalonyl-CoA/oxaloacetate decarboxylase beta subunit